MKVVKLSLVEDCPTPRATLGEQTLHSFYFTLTAIFTICEIE